MLAGASLFVSLVALLIAAFSVYVVSLRHANVVVDVIRADLRHLRLSAAGTPEATSLTVDVLTSNDGARAALVDVVQVGAIETAVGLWQGVSGTGVTPFPGKEVIEANAMRAYTFFFPIENNVGDQAADVEAFFGLVEQLAAIDLRIDWRYHRSSGLPLSAAWLPRRVRRRRIEVRRTLRVPIDVAAYRRSLRDGLTQGGHTDLAARVAESADGAG